VHVNPIIIYRDGGRAPLIDRQTLALITGRSVNTIRARCEVAEHRDGRALYDLDQAEAVLNATPTRRR
jgi:hypothetical protein